MVAAGVLILGAGQAGLQLAASLRQGGYAEPITLVGDEADPPYQRPPLSKAYLTGRDDDAALMLRAPGFYADHAITLRLGETATAIDRAARQVRLASGAALAYDQLVLATGARHRGLAVAGIAQDGVVALRTLAEARALRPRLAAARRLAIIGAGFIGLEVAAVATAAGVAVEVVEATTHPMARALSGEMAQVFTRAHRAAGVRFHFGAVVSRILGDGAATGVETSDGATIPADLVLVGIGVVPNAELAAAAGLSVSNGIVVDEQLATADPLISAVGDCTAYPSRFGHGMVRLESVQNAVDQAKCLAARLLGRPAAYDAVPWFWSDQGSLKLQIAGLGAGHDRTVRRGDPDGERLSVFCFRGDTLLAVESLNSPGDHMAVRRLLAGRVPLTPDQAADPACDLRKLAAG
jgi:3-phenylpropionate/trans-cinnamate dioxygenase ferredoxin reductase subunit